MYASVCRVGLCSFLRVFESACQFYILDETASHLQTVVVVDDSHIERIVLATEKNYGDTKEVSHRPIKCQSHSWLQ